MQPTMTAQLVLDALLMALWRRGKPNELLHHSDQGSQYTSDDFQRLLGDQGITCSIRRKGAGGGNAPADASAGARFACPLPDWFYLTERPMSVRNCIPGQ